MNGKMTLQELVDSGLFGSDTKFFLVTTGSDIAFDPDDFYLAGAFGDYIIDRVRASGDDTVRIFFDVQPARRAAV